MVAIRVTEAWEGPLTRSCWRTGSSQRGTPSTAARGSRLRTSHQQTRSCTPNHTVHPTDTSWLSCSYGGQHGQCIASHVEEAVCAVVHPHRQECCTYAGPGLGFRVYWQQAHTCPPGPPGTHAPAGTGTRGARCRWSARSGGPPSTQRRRRTAHLAAKENCAGCSWDPASQTPIKVVQCQCCRH